MIMNNPDAIEERLEANEADLNAIEISLQAAIAFMARFNPIKCTIPNTPTSAAVSAANQATNPKDSPPKPFYYCNNCGRSGHSIMQCFAPRGGLAGQEPWGKKNIDNKVKPAPIAYQTIREESYHVLYPLLIQKLVKIN